MAPGAQNLEDLIERELAQAEALRQARVALAKGGPRRLAGITSRTEPPKIVRVIRYLNYHLGRFGLTLGAVLQGLAIVLVIIIVLVVARHIAGDLRTDGRSAFTVDGSELAQKTSVWFNAHHSPIGAFASFTLGHKGAKGGLGLELASPANQDVYVMLESRDGSHLDALPFFPVEAAPKNPGFFSEMGLPGSSGGRTAVPMFAFHEEDVRREFNLSTDRWTAGDLTMTIFSPVRGVPNPSSASETVLKEAVVPAVLVEITVDNTDSKRARELVFGYSGSDPYSNMRHFSTVGLGGAQLVGVGQGTTTAILTNAPGAKTSMGWSVQDVVDRFFLPDGRPANRTFGLGNKAGIKISVPAGGISSFQFAVCFFRGGSATASTEMSYLYTRFFRNVESVGAFALNKWAALTDAARAADALLAQGKSYLSPTQQFMQAHAIRAYYGSTQLLQQSNGAPYWVVNEGEYRMMNTFDLTVDQLFFELKMNPWTVRNVLDSYVASYSYQDTVFLPEDPRTLHPGGISFTHDQGVGNVFAPPGTSAYEQGGLSGLFSMMTHEQLVNWVLCAAAYVAREPGDTAWLSQSMSVFKGAFASLKNRDHPVPEERDGIMSCDSSRTQGGAEITTYDSLDKSLGQARDSLYLGGKAWAAYVLLNKIFAENDLPDLAEEAVTQADRAARTMADAMGVDGYIPAVLKGGASDAQTISAIEGLVYPLAAGCREALDPDGRFGNYIHALQRHLTTVLRPGACLFPDGGWKLSSTSDNSWLSKIYLSQFIAHQILGLPRDEAALRADEAHATWLLHGRESYWGWSDQMIAGEAKGSRYYPRGVTAILWLEMEVEPTVKAEGWSEAAEALARLADAADVDEVA